VFGYDNVEALAADGRRSHVARRINEAEAAVVRRIFTLAAGGKGLRAIAHLLNAEHVPAPRPQQDRPRGWAPSSVREVLYRDLYRGLIVWNRTQKRNRWGQAKPHDRAASERVEVSAPALRIVDDALWQGVHARLEGARAIYLRGTNGRLWGRPTSGIESRYLLAGLARCGACGGSLVVRSRVHGSPGARRRVAFYACSSFHHRGAAVCGNSLEMRLEAADEAVLTAFEQHLLDEGILSEAMARALQPDDREETDVDARRAALVARETQLVAELGRLTGAIVAGGEAATLVQAMREREKDLSTTRAALARLTQPQRVQMSPPEAQAALRSRLTDWRGLLRSHVPQARQMVRKLLAGRITFTPQPETRRYAFRIPATLSRFFNGLVCPQGVASPIYASWNQIAAWLKQIDGVRKAA